MFTSNNEDAQWLASLPPTLGFDLEELFTKQQQAAEAQTSAPIAT